MTVTNDVYGESNLLNELESFYLSYVVPTANDAFQVFQSFTYGEMVISGLLAMIVLLFIFKWIWEVLR